MSYYIKKSGGLFELRQTRFEKLEKEHPHDVCAIARTVPEMREMVKLLGGEVDWRGFDFSEPRGKTRKAEQLKGITT